MAATMEWPARRERAIMSMQSGSALLNVSMRRVALKLQEDEGREAAAAAAAAAMTSMPVKK